ncbi:hypothetical protein [Pseudoalteromonas sp. T1lg75]|uniref:hypothetical protein n=1 Tax=Pseudoalteromonas sp. T1lg75 TaxID=2077102 RepID=UPI000CF6DF28|nr:hypothetical protein [Pseudoalteromonas sp. T1lg75]
MPGLNVIKPILSFALVCMLSACEAPQSETQSEMASNEQENTASQALPQAVPKALPQAELTPVNKVEVTTTEYAILAPDYLPTGWTTFSFTNRGGQEHFVAMYRLVEGKTIEDQLREVAPAFDPIMQGLRSGELTKADIGPFLEQNVPDWGLQMTWVGGAGLLSNGHSVEATFNIDKPGIYLLECYVKAPDGQWHTLMGMLHQIQVYPGPTEQQLPEATHNLTVANMGISGPEVVKAGKHTFRIDIGENPPSFLPYDLHLAKLEEGTDLQQVYFWMDWTNVGGLRAPAPVTFLGGIEQMGAGNHGYVSVDLAPGKYLWVSEVNAANINLPFVVTE